MNITRMGISNGFLGVNAVYFIVIIKTVIFYRSADLQQKVKALSTEVVYICIYDSMRSK